jgi:transaldolase
MTISESLQGAIAQERQQREAFDHAGLMPSIERGKGQEALENLIFFASPADFSSSLEMVRREMATRFNALDSVLQERSLHFLAGLILALRSFLPRWNLRNADRHGDAAITDTQVESQVAKAQALISELAARAPTIAARLLARRRAETAARLKAEGADPQGEARPPVGESIGEYLAHACAELAQSNLRRIAEMRVTGQTSTEVSNDYAAFLQHALYLGASFVTCNPPLVDVAWTADPERWNPIVDSIICDNPEADQDGLARLVTLEVVLSNMRLLRPIFLLTAGQMGCVCLQVNPHNHGYARAMISDALSIYEKLRSRLGGGAPNVVFKLPGTQAGLEACRVLTKQGIGVTITVNFGMFQHLPFAEAMAEGEAIFSCLVEMNGRLAYPVRDELLAKLDELAAYGIDEVKAREAAAWAGVAVVKRAHKLLGQRGCDLARIKLLIASLRIYEDDGYAGLPSAFPDVTEVVGAGIISVFPNIRRPFDAQAGLVLDPRRIESPVPAEILETLTHSEIFKQAYYVADRDWISQEDQRFRPDRELRLQDEANVAAWPPVHSTLSEFIRSYDSFVERIIQRKRRLQA